MLQMLAVLLVLFVAMALFSQRTGRARRELLHLHESGPVRATGFDASGENVEIGRVSLEEGLALLDQRCKFAATTPGTDENAEHSGVMFYRSDDDWIGLYARSSGVLDLDVSLSLKQARGHKLTSVNRREAEHFLRTYFTSSASFATGFEAFTSLRTEVDG